MKQITGAEALKLRQKLGMSQTQFWSPLGVTQSGGCRYESGRTVPVPVQKLYYLVYVACALTTIQGKDVRAFHSIGK